MTEEITATSEPASSKLFWKFLIALLIVQAALLLFEQRHEIGHWFTRPFLQADYGYHYYFSTRQAESTLMGQGYTGYDPQMFGGMDLWPQITPSDRVTVLLMTLSPKSWWPAIFNFQYLGMFLLIPALFLASCRRFRLDDKALPYAGAIGLILFWITLPSFLSRGIATFPFSLLLALYIASEIYHLTFSFSHLRAGLIAFGTGALVFTHPASAFVVGFLALTILIARRQNVDKRILLWTGAAALLTFLFNWPWASVLPLFSYSSTSTASALTFSSLRHFWEYHYLVPGVSGLRIFLPTLLVVASLPLLFRDEKYRQRADLAAIWTLFFTALYVFGSFVPLIKLMQPQRFNIGVKVMGALYGVIVVSYLIERWKYGFHLKKAIAAVSVVAAALAVCVWRTGKAYLGDTYATHPMAAVTAMLQAGTPEGARILLIRGPHTPDEPPTVDEQCVAGSFINREFLGTEWIVPTLSKFGHDEVGTSVALVEGKADKAYWNRFRDLWEIEYLSFPAVNLPLYSKWLDRATQIGQAGNYLLYKVEGDTDRLLQGSGHITASLNKLSFSDIQPGEDNSILVAYHHSVGHKLVNAPNATLTRRIVEGDKYGLIEVKNPPKSFDIVFDIDTARKARQ